MMGRCWVMLKKFAPGRGVFPGRGCCPREMRPGLWMRLCGHMRLSLWNLFALSSLMLFGYLLWSPGCYLLIVLFLQVLGLLIWLQNSR